MRKKSSINSLFYDLDQASRICRLFGEQNFKKNGCNEIDFDEFLILDYISLNRGCCQQDITNATLKGKSHISKILNFLETKGYIQRLISRKNNRVIKKIMLTEKGNKIFSATENEMQKILTVIEKTLDNKEVERCRKFLRNIKTAIKNTNYIKLD